MFATSTATVFPIARPFSNKIPPGQFAPADRLSKRLAACRAHSLAAYGGQLAHLQPEGYFLPGTRLGRK